LYLEIFIFARCTSQHTSAASPHSHSALLGSYHHKGLQLRALSQVRVIVQHSYIDAPDLVSSHLSQDGDTPRLLHHYHHRRSHDLVAPWRTVGTAAPTHREPLTLLWSKSQTPIRKSAIPIAAQPMRSPQAHPHQSPKCRIPYPATLRGLSQLCP
jgi:hypothetical protein